MYQANFLRPCRALGALAAALTLAACAGVGSLIGPSVRAYDGPERPDPELAELVASRVLTPSAYAAFVAVDGRMYGDMVTGFPVSVKVLPGEHRVSVACPATGGGFAYPALSAVFRAGHVYEFRCRQTPHGTVAAAMVDLGQTHVALPRPQ